MARPRLATATIADDGRIVPWLSASGPLAYTPEAPPARDYYFQYGWVMPGILCDRVNKRCHFYFGASIKDRAASVFAFWNAARSQTTTRVAVLTGECSGDTVTAPMAIYRMIDRLHGPVYVFIQHGSYQVLKADEQPLLDAGDVVLYRGIGAADRFRFDRVGSRELTGDMEAVWSRYAATQMQVMSDAVVSFNSIHDRARRSETTHIRDGTWITDAIAADNGLDVTSDGPAKDLWSTTHQSFSLARWVADQKFGPNYVKCKTPANNIRMTTFFAGEHEVRIIDPDRVEFLECIGCRVNEHSTAAP